MSRVARRLREERGFTLIELLAAMSVGCALMLAILSMTDLSAGQTAKTTERVDVSQRGRQAMQEVVRVLRSQVCPDSGTPAIVGGTATTAYQVTLYVSYSPTAAPERHVVAWDTNSNSLVDTTYAASGAVTPRTIATNVKPPGGVGSNQPVFTFLRYQSGDTSRPTQVLTPPLTATDVAAVAEIDVAFRVLPVRANPNGATYSPQSGTFTSRVFARTADPNNTNKQTNQPAPLGPVCA
jgi:prepilin-type N-terminal cleavage/methylation domain-containing protein